MIKKFSLNDFFKEIYFRFLSFFKYYKGVCNYGKIVCNYGRFPVDKLLIVRNYGKLA